MALFFAEKGQGNQEMWIFADPSCSKSGQQNENHEYTAPFFFCQPAQVEGLYRHYARFGAPLTDTNDPLLR